MLPCHLKTRLGGIIFGICLRAKEKSGKILLNITGGGYKRLKADHTMNRIDEWMEIKSSGQLTLDAIETEVSEFVEIYT